MIQVGIIGVTGYTAIEAIRWLLQHPEAKVAVATSRQSDGTDLVEVARWSI